MAHYSVHSRVRMFVKGYGFFLLLKIRSTSKNISKNLSGKYSQKPLDHAEQCATGALKLLLKEQFKKQ